MQPFIALGIGGVSIRTGTEPEQRSAFLGSVHTGGIDPLVRVQLATARVGQGLSIRRLRRAPAAGGDQYSTPANSTCTRMSVQFSAQSPMVHPGAGGTPAGVHEDEADWPLEKLLARHQDLSQSGDARKPAVLLTTGAMNPVHLGHVDMFARARRCLEQEHGYSVLAGYISPSHEGYVRPKCEHFRQRYLDSDVRLECVRRAVHDSEWLECGAWEAAPARGSWPDYPVVVKALQSRLAGLERDLSLGGQKCTIFYVCGLDHFKKCNLSAGLRSCSLPTASSIEDKPGVVAIPRDDAPPARTDLKRLVIGVTECNPELSHLSSTRVRKLLSGSKASEHPVEERRALVAEVVGEAVAELLLPSQQLSTQTGGTEPSELA